MTEQLSLSTTPRRYRLSVEDYLRLDEAGAFEGLGKTELIRGEVFFLNAQHRPHARMKMHLHRELVQALGQLETGLDIVVEATVSMPPHSAPEPDLILTSEPDGEGPVPVATVRLLIEVADTTQRHDLRTKAGIYAENGVPEYWVVDLKARQVHRMAQSGPDGYADVVTLPLGARIEAATITGLAFDLPA